MNFLYFRHTETFTEIQGYVSETCFPVVSVDVIRQNVDGNTRLLVGNIFLLFLLMYPDLEGRKYNVLFQKHFFFSACAVVVFSLPFSLLQDRLICCDRAFFYNLYQTYTVRLRNLCFITIV